ncbi:unnamed protein product [Boreogadus saida]
MLPQQLLLSLRCSRCGELFRVRYEAEPGLAAGRVLGVMVVVLRLLLLVQGDVGAGSATCVLREPREVLSACWAHCSYRAMLETVKENQAAGKASGSSPCRAVFLRCCSCARPADSAEDA